MKREPTIRGSGYMTCNGCGRLFGRSNPVERAVFDQHDCDWNDATLDRAIAREARRQEERRKKQSA
jgi:hypothetical protein